MQEVLGQLSKQTTNNPSIATSNENVCLCPEENRAIPFSEKSDNYRPISILVVSKIIERAEHNHVYVNVTQNCILNVHQSGFRPKYSIETAF